ncbi:hypothetical protein BT67DRAFT_442942 [Trichocladium antarcticum]|uniref:Uncharacterized protein n=1 Tax=Trichocladium antarcticum TaxID=1450529 RepID=A0AAN6UI82_9PEZI|nr:hypothetical protein BT67DRAFT_442942 [Trichocladium antarcticum]
MADFTAKGKELLINSLEATSDLAVHTAQAASHAASTTASALVSAALQTLSLPSSSSGMPPRRQEYLSLTDSRINTCGIASPSDAKSLASSDGDMSDSFQEIALQDLAHPSAADGKEARKTRRMRRKDDAINNLIDLLDDAFLPTIRLMDRGSGPAAGGDVPRDPDADPEGL